MWVLQNSKDCDIRFYLVEGQEYTVGRRDCRILILNDSSVSRNHAKFTVTHSDANLSNPLARPLLTLHESSKFGSLRNGAKLARGDTPLEDGDLIVFGATNSNKWTVTYEPLVVAFSSLPSAEKKSLKLLTRKLGGHVVSEWSKECTHLIMTQLMVTIKGLSLFENELISNLDLTLEPLFKSIKRDGDVKGFLHVIGALVSCRHIVTPEFLRKIKEAAAADSGMPDPLNYSPTLVEASINETDVSFQPNADRQTLLMGKTVVFLTAKQLKQLGQTVELAGGMPVLMDEGMTRSEEKLFTDPSTIVMYADPQDQAQILTQTGQEWATRVMDILKRSDLRPIPQSELGLAVLYASTEVHCNPRVAQAGLTLLHPVAAPSLTQDVLASETQLSKLPRSHAPETRKTSSVRTQQQEKTTDTGPEKSSKKRVREEDSTEFSAPSKLPRKEPGKPSDHEQPPSTSIIDAIIKNAVPLKTKGSAVSNASLKVSGVGNSASEHPSGSKETRKTVNLDSNTESNSINERDLSKQAPSLQKWQNSATAAATRTSSQKHLPEGQVKAGATNTSKKGNLGSGSDGDILSPSERFDETKTRSLNHNPNPHRLKRDFVTIEDRVDEADGGTLSRDDVSPPLGRRDVRGSERDKDIHHPHQFSPEDQSVKKEQDVCEVAGADSEEDIIPASRKTNDEMGSRKKNRKDHKSVSRTENSALEPQAMIAKKEPSEGGTIPEDVLLPSGSDDRRRRTGKRRREDLVAMDIEDGSQKRYDVTEEGSGMDKFKKTRLVKEDYEGSTTDLEPRPHDANSPLQEIPTGFISANKNVKCEPSSPEDPTLPYNLAIVEQVGLVIRIARVPSTMGKTDTKKNFKKFKKASYVGQFSMPHIIGGSDLYHSETRQNAEARAEMARERKILQKQREEKELEDDLFNWDIQPIKRRR